jgi:hypothetical protein
MKRHYIALFFLSLAFACDTSSNIKPPDQSYFIKFFGGDGNQQAVGLIVNTDGTFFILGNSRKATGEVQKVYLAKADAQGKLMWQTTYGNVEMEAKDFKVVNGSIVVAANRRGSDSDVMLIRFTLNGDTVQSARLSIESQLTASPKNEYAASLAPLNDGGFLVTGYTDYVGGTSHQWDALHFRTDNAFTQRLNSQGWNETSGQGNINKSIGAFQIQNDSIYVFGSTDGPAPTTDLDFWMFGLDSKGVQRGVYNYVANNSDDQMTNAMRATQGGYLLSGVSVDKNSSNVSLKIAKIRFDNLSFDPTGNDIQINYAGRSLGNGAALFATACNSTSGYFALANVYNSAGTSDMILIKLDVSLREVWDNPITLGGDGDDTAAAVAELPDGHIIVLGTMNLGNPAEQFKIALMKLNSAGRLSE